MPPPLQTYESTASNATGSTGPMAQPALFEQQTMAPGRGLMQLGAALFETGQRRADQDEAMWIAETEGMARSHWAKRFEELETTGGDGFTQSFKGEYNNYIKGLIKSAPSARAAQKLGLQLQNFGTGLYNRAAKKEAAARVQEVADKLDNIVGLGANELLVKGGYDKLDEVIGRVDETITSMGGRIPSTSKTSEKAREVLTKAAIEGLIQNGEGGKALQEIDSLKFSDVLDTGDLVSLRSRAINAAKTRSVENREAAKKFSDNMLAIMENEGQLPTNYSNIDAAVQQYGQYFTGSGNQDAEMAEFKTNLEMVQNTYSVLQEVKSASPGEAASILARLRPATDDPDYARKNQMYDYAVKSVQKYQQLLDEDPVSAISSTPLVKGKAAELSAAQKALAENPSLDNGRAEKAKQDYFDSILAAQQVAGVPSYRRTVVSTGDASRLAADIKNAGANEVESVLTRVQETYGKHFPSVMASMARLKGDSALDSKFVLIASHMNKPYTAELIRALQTPTAELDKLIPENNIRRQIEDGVALRSETMDFVEALTAAGARPESINGARESAKAYAKYKYGYQRRGVSESIKSSAQTLFSASYAYGKINGNKFAIPRQLPDGTTFSDRELKNIERNLERKLSEIQMLAKPSLLTGYTSIQNPSKEFEISTQRYIDNFTKLGYFSTAPDFSGVFFTMDQDPQYGTSRSNVYFNNMSTGKPSGPLYFSYKDLANQ
jgi:hypothetical protein